MRNFIFSLVIFVSAFSGVSSGKSYKIGGENAAPAVLMDGVPVRARQFYGAYFCGASPKSGTEFRDFTLDFTLDSDNSGGGIKLVLSNSVRHAYISKVQIENLDDNSVADIYDFSAAGYDKSKLSYRFPDNLNPKPLVKMENIELDGVRVLHIEKEQGSLFTDRLVFHFRPFNIKKNVNYRARFSICTDVESQVRLISYIIPPYKIISENRRDFLVPQVKIAAKAGVHFVHFGVRNLTAKNDVDAQSAIDEVFKRVIEANPKVRAIVRLGSESEIHRKNHPDEIMRDFTGKPITRPYDGSNYSSPSSESFRKYAQDSIRLTIEYIESKFGANVAGYHPCGGQSGEFFYGASGDKILAGYDAATLRAWRKWLRAKYTTDDALRAAWNNPKVSLDSAAVPTPDERTVGVPALLHPKKNASVIDFNLFLQDEMADHVLGIARVARETERKLGVERLNVFFYGYAYELASYFNGPAVSGHYALRKILDSPDIDILAAPISYYYRKLGGAKLNMCAADSVALSGKMFFDEDDTRTYLLWTSGSPVLIPDQNQQTVDDSRKVLRRNLAQEIVRNHGSWWMDLFGCGWFNDPKLWREAKNFKRSENRILQNPSPYRPDFALVHSDRAICYIGGNNSAYKTSFQLLHWSRQIMNEAAIPFAQYELSDVLAGRTSAKLNAFILASVLDSKERAKLAEIRRTSAAIWAWTPALVDIDKHDFSLLAVKEATGFDAEYVVGVSARVSSSEAGLAAGLPANFGIAEKISPLLSPVPRKNDIVLASYSNGKPAVVLRTSEARPQLFVGTTFIPRALFRFMAEKSGVHIYSKQPVSVFVNNQYVSICATSSELHTFDFASDKPIYDALSGKLLGNGPILNLDLKQGDAFLLRLGN